MAIAADLIGQTGSLGRIEQLEVIAALLDRLIEHAPSPEHRLAIEIASHARVTSEALLSDAIEPAFAGELFAWLRGLSFMEIGAEGLMPHDLARDVVHSDSHGAASTTTRRSFAHAQTLRLYREGASNESTVLRDLVYHRLNPIMRAFFEFRAIGHVYAEPATAGDRVEYLSLFRVTRVRPRPLSPGIGSSDSESFLAMRSAQDRWRGLVSARSDIGR